MDVRPYQPDDLDRCLTVFDSNAPRFFASGERDEFAAFLKEPGCPYFVMEHDGGVVGCGGYFLKAEQGLARLVWGMVRADVHKLGLGRFLLLFRLREIGKIDGIQMVGLDTSQLSASFFEKQGFKIAGVVPDGYGPGLNRVQMVKRLTVCA